eukprot:1361683-Pleurochrysis_carterae.AAC.1
MAARGEQSVHRARSRARLMPRGLCPCVRDAQRAECALHTEQSKARAARIAPTCAGERRCARTGLR